MDNPYAQFTQDILSCLSTNLYTMNAHSTEENLWLNSTQDLNQAWNMGTPDDNGTIQKWLTALEQEQDGYKEIESGNWIKTYLGGQGKLDLWSAAMIAKAMSALGALKHPSSSDDSSWSSALGQAMNALQQYNTVITSKQSSETQDGDSEGKAMASLIQNDTAQQTPIKDACDSFLAVLNSFASLLSTI